MSLAPSTYRGLEAGQDAVAKRKEIDRYWKGTNVERLDEAYDLRGEEAVEADWGNVDLAAVSDHDWSDDKADDDEVTAKYENQPLLSARAIADIMED